MISLFNILKESTKPPKALILAGAPGSGKGFILKSLNLNNIKVLNIDNYFIELLKQQKVSLDLKNHSSEERSIAAKAMASSNVPFRKEKENIIQNRDSFILDGTASSYKNTLELKNELEDIGYDVFMLYVYTDLERALKQNQERYSKSGGKDRSLLPQIILRNWEQVTNNYVLYKDLFKNNFISVSNTLETSSIKDLEDIKKEFIFPFSLKDTKPKTEKERERKKKEIEKLDLSLNKILNSDYTKNIINNSVSKEEAQNKIISFFNN